MKELCDRCLGLPIVNQFWPDSGALPGSGAAEEEEGPGPCTGEGGVYTGELGASATKRKRRAMRDSRSGSCEEREGDS